MSLATGGSGKGAELQCRGSLVGRGDVLTEPRDRGPTDGFAVPADWHLYHGGWLCFGVSGPPACLCGMI